MGKLYFNKAIQTQKQQCYKRVRGNSSFTTAKKKDTSG